LEGTSLMRDLWILAGQSNMEGCGNLEDLELPAPDIRAFIHGDQWRIAAEPLHWLLEATDPVHHGDRTPDQLAADRAEARRSRIKGSGLGLTFAKAVAAGSGTPIDLIPCAHGGTSMAQWNPELAPLGGKSLFGAMLRRTRLALATSPQTRVKGVLWYQGESDADAESAKVYRKRMHTLIAEFRKQLDVPDLPFLMVQLGPFACSEHLNSRWWTEIREIQRTLPDEIPGAGVVPAIDLETDDAIHIGTQGHKRLGHRMANLALRTVYDVSTAPSPVKWGKVTSAQNGQITTIRVEFEGVNGQLVTPDPAGRIPGIALEVDGVVDPAHTFKTMLDPDAPNAVLLCREGELPPGAKLTYGTGFQPFCQLTDTADMAVPAAGPLTIDAGV
jgi:sialate O-acetylesterase